MTMFEIFSSTSASLVSANGWCVDWRKKVAAIRVKILKEFSSLLKDMKVMAVLNQRLIELRKKIFSPCSTMCKQLPPLVLQQYCPDIIEPIVVDIYMAISLLSNKISRDLIMILNSKRCFKLNNSDNGPERVPYILIFAELWYRFLGTGGEKTPCSEVKRELERYG